MRLSQYFLPLLKETPKEAQIASHRLMLRAGMIQQSSAGIYSWLPLGKKGNCGGGCGGGGVPLKSGYDHQDLAGLKSFNFIAFSI